MSMSVNVWWWWWIKHQTQRSKRLRYEEWSEVKYSFFFDVIGSSGARSLSAANRRKLSFLAHGKFRTRLVHTLGDPLRRSNRIVWMSEEYTSKLCSRCFRWTFFLLFFALTMHPTGIFMNPKNVDPQILWLLGWQSNVQVSAR